MMELINSINLLNSLPGSVVSEVRVEEWVWTEINNITFDNEHRFIYCTPVYLKLENYNFIIKFISILEEEYSLLAGKIDNLTYEAEKKCVSEVIHGKILKEYSLKEIKKVSIGLDVTQNYIENIMLSFDQGLDLYLFSGDYEEENDGHFRVVGPDEMILLFFKKEDFQYFGFSHNCTISS